MAPTPRHAMPCHALRCSALLCAALRCSALRCSVTLLCSVRAPQPKAAEVDEPDEAAGGGTAVEEALELEGHVTHLPGRTGSVEGWCAR